MKNPNPPASKTTTSKRSASPEVPAAKKSRRRNQDKVDNDRIAAQFKLCTLTLGSLQHLTGALDKQVTSYQSLFYRAIVNGIRDYNLDMQKINRLVNERFRQQLENQANLPNSIMSLIKHLVSSISKKNDDKAFHFTTSILNQMV